MARRMVIECPACRGQGHVESHPCSCLGWGHLLVEVVGPCDGGGRVQGRDIEATYAEREAAERERLAHTSFEDWDDEQRLNEQRLARARRRLASLIVPEWTLS